MATTSACTSLYCAGRPLEEAYRDPKAQALVTATVRGNSERVKTLVDEGANPNHLEPDTVPALLWAICADNVEGFKALLEAGADPNLGGTGHGLGHGNGLDLKENGSHVREGWSALVMAGGTARPDFLRLALQYGGKPDIHKGTRSDGYPLMQAAYHGLFDNVKILVAAGADINIHDERYKTSTVPGLAIGITGRYDIALWLLEQGYNHDLQGLAQGAESRHVDTKSWRQRDKEKLIDILRARGFAFPASNLIKAGVKSRLIPAEELDDVIYGRRSVWSYPKRPGQEKIWP